MKFSRDLGWYIWSTAFYLVPGGIQAVLFPWLIAVYLMESPTRVGIAQMAGPLPMLFLILFGGWLGDRVDQRKLSVNLSLAMMVPPLLMVVLSLTDNVTYELLIAWVILAGTLAAFAQPARDAMLNRVAGQDVQQIVTLVIGVQFGVQILGFAVGSSADVMGPAAVLGCMAAFMLLSALVTRQLPPMPAETASDHSGSPLREIKEGLLVAWNHQKIRPAIIMIFGVGLFFASAYMVILPLMVRDIYDGGARGIAMAYGANMLGICVEFLGVRNAVLVAGAGMIILLLYLLVRTRLYEVRRNPVIA